MGRAQCNWLLVVNKCPVLKDVANWGLGYVHPVPDDIWPARKPYRIGLLFTHKNGDFGTISVLERSPAWPISEVYQKMSYPVCVAATFWCSVNRHLDRSGFGARTGFHWDGCKYSGVRTGIWFIKPSLPTAPAGWMLTTCSSHCDVAAHTIPDSIFGMLWAWH